MKIFYFMPIICSLTIQAGSESVLRDIRYNIGEYHVQSLNTLAKTSAQLSAAQKKCFQDLSQILTYNGERVDQLHATVSEIKDVLSDPAKQEFLNDWIPHLSKQLDALGKSMRAALAKPSSSAAAPAPSSSGFVDSARETSEQLKLLNKTLQEIQGEITTVRVRIGGLIDDERTTRRVRRDITAKSRLDALMTMKIQTVTAFSTAVTAGLVPAEEAAPFVQRLLSETKTYFEEQ